jgi:hypothetical protein
VGVCVSEKNLGNLQQQVGELAGLEIMAFKVYTVAHPVQRVLNKENKLWCYACRRSKHQQCAGRRRLGHGQWAVGRESRSIDASNQAPWDVVADNHIKASNCKRCPRCGLYVGTDGECRSVYCA